MVPERRVCIGTEASNPAKVLVTQLPDRLMHHGHLLNDERSWRLKESAARLAKHHADA